jgi:DNA-binding transcriptional LysR family regulator
VGQAFYQRCAGMLADMSEAESAVHETTLNPSGVLPVTSSLSFVVNQIAPILPEFRRRYPRLRVQLEVANRYSDFIEAEAMDFQE